MEKKHKSIWLLFDRILAQDILRQAFILIIILMVVLVASFVLLSLSGADWITYCNENNISKWVFPLYLLIDGNAFNSFYVSDKVSGGTVFVAGVIYVIGVIIFTGMLISVMTNMIERRVEDHKEGHIHYLESGHYIIMGFDEMVPSFIRYVFEKDHKAFVLILTSVEAERVREKLNKTFSKEQLQRIIINYGHRTNPESYKDICLESAEEVFIVGYHSQTAHDAINVECVDAICDYLGGDDIKNKPRRITCVFKDLDTYAAFKTTEIFGEVSKLGIEFIPYNFYTGWAKQVFVKRGHKELSSSGQKIEYPAVYGEGIGPDDKKYVHLVFVGTTNFAVAFAMEAANVLHFPNFNQDKSLKTRITFIDLNADKEKDEFITRNRHFFEVQDYIYRDLSDSLRPMAYKMPATYFREDASNFLDVEFEFIKGDIFSKRVQDEISRLANATDEQYLSIFLAMANQRNNFVIGMNMPDEVYDNHIRQDDAGINQRIVHGVSPGENIMVNSVVIGKTNSDKLTLIAKDNHIVDIVGGELKSHGLEKLGEVDLESAIIKTGLLRHAKVTPRVISNKKPDDFIVTFLDHAGEDVYKFRNSSLVITVGDDTTLISSDILYRFDIPVIGITDGDLDKVVEDGFKVKDSIIFEVESGFDDIIGHNIKKEIFGGKQESYDFTDIDDVKVKIEEIIKNINCKYKINYIN